MVPLTAERILMERGGDLEPADVRRLTLLATDDGREADRMQAKAELERLRRGDGG